MADLSKQGISNVTRTVRQEAPAGGFHKTAPCTKDAGRVVLGGACGGVKVNNKDKVRC